MGRRSDRDQTEDELVDFVSEQLRMTRQLGFPALTIQATTPLEAVRRLVPVAEGLDVVLGLEIGPQSALDGVAVVTARDLMDELDTPFLGFVLDFGSSTRQLSPEAIAAHRERGVSEEALEEVQRAYDRIHGGESDGATEGRRLVEALGPLDDPEFLTFAWRSNVLFGHQPIVAWKPLVPRVVHVHAKAFEMDERGDDPCVDAPALVQMLWEGGYSGWMSSEWEGHLFVDHVDNFGPVVRQQERLRRQLAQLAAGGDRISTTRDDGEGLR